MNDHVTLTGLARQMVLAELMDEKTAQQAQQQAQRNKLSLVTYLVQSKLVKSRALAELASEQFGVPFVDLNTIDKDSQPKELVAEKLVRQHRVLPLWRRGNKLFLAVSDPTNHQSVTDIQFSTGLNTEAILVEDDKLGEAIEKFFESANSGMTDLGDVDLDAWMSRRLMTTARTAAKAMPQTMPQWCASSIRCCWMRSRWAHPTCTSSPMRRPTGCAFAPTVSCMKSPARLSS